MKLLIGDGTRPNLIKLAPFIREVEKYKDRISYKIINTGQHFDNNMFGDFLKELEIPEPGINLKIGYGTHGDQVGRSLIGFEKICLSEKPDIIVVVGDVNSTLGCALAVSKLNIKLAHIEAGLRSFDNSMPEEINRILVDRISDYLFAPNEIAVNNLINEGINKEKINLVGNIIADNLFNNLQKINSKKNVSESYIVLTLHRSVNVDNKENLESILEAVDIIARQKKIIFPIHPRTKKMIEKFSLSMLIKNINVVPPMRYLEFLNQIRNSELVMTDSGGLQIETSILNIPCFTLRNETEWLDTLTKGTNCVVGNNREGILENFKRHLSGFRKKRNFNILWDGKTAERILKILFENGEK
jgi:UDP-N-acetylglucosamine 2-epimerase (non-hydrolysing)